MGEQQQGEVTTLPVEVVTMEIIQEVTHMQLKVQLLRQHQNHLPTTPMECPVSPPSTPMTWPATAGARYDHQPRSHPGQRRTKRNHRPRPHRFNTHQGFLLVDGIQQTYIHLVRLIINCFSYVLRLDDILQNFEDFSSS